MPGIPSFDPTQKGQEEKSGGPSSFNIASFNVLGVSHTGKGGNQHPTWKDNRMGGTLGYLRKHDVDVAGLQEFQNAQQKEFRNANSGYDSFGDGANTIIWKSDRFRKVKSTNLKVPYFEGKMTNMPVVQLEDTATGKRFWVVNIHNPANTKTHHNQGRFRARALELEKQYVAKLRESGLPVYLMGDFNAADDPKRVLAQSGPMTNAGAGERSSIDMIFGAGPMSFANYRRDTSTSRERVSDHPIVVARTTID